jgi:hypothetical protein
MRPGVGRADADADPTPRAERTACPRQRLRSALDDRRAQGRLVGFSEPARRRHRGAISLEETTGLENAARTIANLASVMTGSPFVLPCRAEGRAPNLNYVVRPPGP